MSQSNERIPICLVGCGGMGHRHTLAYHTLEETGLSNMNLMAVCDIRQENAERVAGEVERLFGHKPLIFTDLDTMLAHPDIAAVDVVTDGSTHHNIATAALEAGKHVLCEKPITTKSEDAWQLVHLAEEKGVQLMVGHVFLFNKGIEYLAQAGRDGAEGGDETDLEKLIEHNHNEMTELMQAISETDPQMVRAVERTRGKIRDELTRLLSKLRNSRQNREGTGARQIRRISSALRPRGRPQERVLTVLPFLSAHGIELVSVRLSCCKTGRVNNQYR